MPSYDSSPDVLLERLAAEFVERHRNGEHPPLSEYTDRYPDLSADIRDLFPALVQIENLKPAEATGAFVPSQPSPDGPKLERLGDYRILREVGRGGMGVVYEAEQESLGRHVALKVLPSSALLNPTYLERFRREAKAAARLHHTNIVPVFGVGEAEGVHFYAMQFIRGEGLNRVLTDVRRLRRQSGGALAMLPSERSVAHSLLTGRFAPAPDASQTELAERSQTSSATSGLSGTSPEADYCRGVARIGVQVAEALAYAHRQGILHRDIKPSNLLLDLQGTVWITDFGLAKAEGTAELTHTGDIVGTIRFMAPERFEGKSLPQSDVYALGVTLYEMLTLRPAFDDTNKAKLIDKALHEPPTPPRKLDPRIPRDLETIVLKCLAKEPVERYPSADAVAEDLKCFLTDRPIKARRATVAEQAWRWCRRNPVLAGLAAGIVLVTVLGFAGVLWQWRLADQARAVATEKAEDEAKARRDRELMLTDMFTSFGLAAGARDDPRQAVLWFANAAQLAGDDSERADANRTRASAWGRQAIRPVRAFVHPAEWIENNLAFHPDGRYLLSHGYHPDNDQTDCRLWDVEREVAQSFPGNPSAVSTAAWDATGERLVVGTPEGEVTITRFPGGELLQRVPFAGRIARVLFSPDGRFCAVAAAKRVRVWDCQRATFVTPELQHPAPVSTLAFHPKGELLATGCEDQTCRVFPVQAENNTPLFPPVPHRAPEHRNVGHTPIPPLFLDEGQGLLTHDQHEVSWRDPRTGRILRRLPFGEPGMVETVDAVNLSADGKRVVLAGVSFQNAHARIYDGATAQPVSPNLEHRSLQFVLSAAFSPSGWMLLTGSGDHTVRLWSVPSGKPLAGPLTHPTSVSAVAFTPSGHHLATAQRGGHIRLWAFPRGNPRDHYVPVGSHSLVRLSRDGRFLLPSGLSQRSCSLRKTQVVDLSTRQRVGPPLEANGIILDAAFSPDGRQVATAVSLVASGQERHNHPGQQPGELLLWDWQAGKLQHKPLQLPSEPRQLDYSSDGKYLAVLGADGKLIVIDPGTGRMLRQWQSHLPHPANNYYINNGAVRFSPDNRNLLTFVPSTKSVCVWDAATGQLQHELKHNGTCHDVQFSPNGRLVSTAGWDNQVCVWELATGELLSSLPHPDWTFTASFSPCGKYLLTACRDGMARLWDWRACKLLCPPFEHEHEVYAVAFTPDGRHILSTSNDGFLKIWEWRTGKLVCPSFALGGVGLSLAMTPDGHQVARGGYLSVLPIIQLDDWLAPSPLGPDDLCLWGEILSGQRIEAGGGVTNLTADEWLQRWRSFRRAHPDFAGTILQKPDHRPIALNNQAWQLVNGPVGRRNPARALELIREAIKQEPESAMFLNTLGVVQYRNGQHKEAVVALEKSLAAGKGLADAFDLFFLAMCHAKLGDAVRAKDCFDRAVRWVEEQKNLSPAFAEDLKVFRTEAEAVLRNEPPK